MKRGFREIENRINKTVTMVLSTMRENRINITGKGEGEMHNR